MVVEETGCCDRRAIDALAELPEHEREGWQRGNRLGLRILCVFAALSRHRAGDGTGSPQVGLSRSPGSAWLAPALFYVSQARAARSPSLRWLVATARRLRSPSRTTGTKKGCRFAYAGCLQSPTCPAARSMSLWANACGQHGRSPSQSGNPRRQPRSHRTGDVIDQTSASSRDRRKSGRCCRHPSEITRSR